MKKHQSSTEANQTGQEENEQGGVLTVDEENVDKEKAKQGNEKDLRITNIYTQQATDSGAFGIRC